MLLIPFYVFNIFLKKCAKDKTNNNARNGVKESRGFQAFAEALAYSKTSTVVTLQPFIG